MCTYFVEWNSIKKVFGCARCTGVLVMMSSYLSSKLKAMSHGAIFLATCNSTFERCKIGNYKFPSQFANIFLTYQTFVSNLHLLRVELRCKLQEKLHRVTWPLLILVVVTKAKLKEQSSWLFGKCFFSRYIFTLFSGSISEKCA